MHFRSADRGRTVTEYGKEWPRYFKYSGTLKMFQVETSIQPVKDLGEFDGIHLIVANR